MMLATPLSKEIVLSEFQEWLIDNNGKTRASVNLYKGIDCIARQGICL